MQIKVFPNPASDYLNIEWEEAEHVTITLVNAVGQLAFFDNILFANEFRLDLEDLEKGFYHAKIEIGNQIINEKIVIK